MSDKRFKLSTLGWVSFFHLTFMLTGCGGAENAAKVAQNIENIAESFEAEKSPNEIIQPAFDHQNDEIISTTRHETPHTSVKLEVSNNLASKDEDSSLVDLIDYSDVKLSEYTPEQHAKFSNFTPYTLTIDQPVPEFVDQKVVYLKVVDDHGNQLYLGELPLDQIMDLDFELEVGVEVLHLQFFADGLETILGVVSL